MIFAVLTALCWTVSAYCSSRGARAIGSAAANRWRLSLGGLLLLCIHLLWVGPEWNYPGLWLFLLAGVLHLGLGDTTLYASFRLLGPRLGGLIILCLSIPVAGLGEYFLLGTALTPAQIGLSLVIVGGVWLALAPTERLRLGPAAIRAGLWVGLAGACLHGSGALVTRLAYDELKAAEASLPPLSAALLRVLGGLTLLLAIRLLGSRFLRDVDASYSHVSEKAQAQTGKRIWPFIATSAVIGPVLGVGSYQHALSQAPAALVQAIVACIPLGMVPLAWAFDGDRPSLRSLCGGLVAVSGVIALVIV